MTIIISTLTDLTKLHRYEDMRDAPRRFLEHGVFPSGDAAIIAYGRLLEALQGGHEATEEEPYTIEDLSAFAEFHTNTLAQVSAFVAAIQVSIHVSNDTMQIINLLSSLTQPDEPIPFNIPEREITIPDYLTTLATAIATLQATQAAARMRGGNNG
jgi:uncharacterized protein YifE (UPF0438 family)